MFWEVALGHPVERIPPSLWLCSELCCLDVCVVCAHRRCPTRSVKFPTLSKRPSQCVLSWGAGWQRGDASPPAPNAAHHLPLRHSSAPGPVVSITPVSPPCPATSSLSQVPPLPTDVMSNFPQALRLWNRSAWIPLLCCLPRVWHGQTFLSKGHLLFPRTTPLPPLPRNCPPPSLSIPVTHTYSCTEQQWSTIDPVFTERGWQRASLSHPQGCSRKGWPPLCPSAPPPLLRKCEFRPHILALGNRAGSPSGLKASVMESDSTGQVLTPCDPGSLA